ncbi:hypothetical protein OJAV_G00214460 [Oryzias javanicus]|uniref:Pseudouridine synthase n=1 Tax=Oryzias javanicus TaxID=123683 RepID=A0A437C3Q4_ORYJA|nr:hypothetical protein OJAV_G00214460 [Oryzias javanicus]
MEQEVAAGDSKLAVSEVGSTRAAAAKNGKRKKDAESDGNVGGKKRREAGGKTLRPGERYVPPPQKRNPGVSFSQEHFSETSYYFEGGLRKNNDHMKNTVHRHEPPVVGTPLDILVDDGQVLVVDKPASIPVHPCGRFRHNTVIFILGKECGVSELHTVHRLDRLTSGVLLFARTVETSKKLDQMVRDREIEKEYVCRVEGEFPEGEVVCEEPILVVSFKVGLCRVDPKGKECRTVFQRLSFNGKTSVVRCFPLTGRTHQIRVHLQYLGFPIKNDPIYGSSAWGPNRGKGGVVGRSDEEILQALVEEHRSQENQDFLDDLTGGKEAAEKTVTDTCRQQVDPCGDETDVITDGTKESNNPATENGSKSADVTKGSQDHLCSECKIVRPDPTEKELIMYLHALRYKGPDFEYSTRLPEWAKEDWVEPW